MQQIRLSIHFSSSTENRTRYIMFVVHVDISLYGITLICCNKFSPPHEAEFALVQLRSSPVQWSNPALVRNWYNAIGVFVAVSDSDQRLNRKFSFQSTFE